MELVAMDMKLRGMYIARQLSFYGTSFKIQEIPVQKEFVKVYNEAVKLVRALRRPIFVTRKQMMYFVGLSHYPFI